MKVRLHESPVCRRCAKPHVITNITILWFNINRRFVVVSKIFRTEYQIIFVKYLKNCWTNFESTFFTRTCYSPSDVAIILFYYRCTYIQNVIQVINILFFYIFFWRRVKYYKRVLRQIIMYNILKRRFFRLITKRCLIIVCIYIIKITCVINK